MTKSFSVEVTTEELSLLLKKALLTHPHKEIITKVILNNLDTTQVGMVQLFKALNGIDNEIKWKVGMNVLVKDDTVYSSAVDKMKMREIGMIHQGWIKAHITKISIYNSYPITVTLEAINTTNGGIFSHVQTTTTEYLAESDQWPEFQPIKDDLPF